MTVPASIVDQVSTGLRAEALQKAADLKQEALKYKDLSLTKDQILSADALNINGQVRNIYYPGFQAYQPYANQSGTPEQNAANLQALNKQRQTLANQTGDPNLPQDAVFQRGQDSRNAFIQNLIRQGSQQSDGSFALKVRDALNGSGQVQLQTPNGAGNPLSTLNTPEFNAAFNDPRNVLGQDQYQIAKTQAESQQFRKDNPSYAFNMDVFNAQTPLDIASTIAAGAIGIEGSIAQFLIGVPEWFATIGSGLTKQILTKQRFGKKLTPKELAFTHTFDFLTQKQTVESFQKLSDTVANGFQAAADFVKTDRVKAAQDQLYQDLGDSIDQGSFASDLASNLIGNPLGTISSISESLPFMLAAGKEVTRLPFAIQYTAQNYQAGLDLYRQKFGTEPDTAEKALIVGGAAFIAAINSSAARYVNGEALVENLGSKVMQTAVGKFVENTATKLGASLVPKESNRLASFLLNASKKPLSVTGNIATRGASEFAEEGIEPLVAAASVDPGSLSLNKKNFGFDANTIKQAKIGGAIGLASGAGIYSGTKVLQIPAKGLEKYSQGAVRRQDARDSASIANDPNANFTQNIIDRLDNGKDVAFKDFNEVDMQIDKNYDPVRRIREPVDTNNKDAVLRRIGDISNLTEIIKQMTPKERKSDLGKQYELLVGQQLQFIPSLREQAQSLGNAELQKADTPAKKVDVLQNVYLGSSIPPIATDTKENRSVRDTLESVKTEFIAKHGQAAFTSMANTLDNAISISEQADALRTKYESRAPKSAGAAKVHQDVILGFKDGKTEFRGGEAYRRSLLGRLELPGSPGFDAEIKQLDNFITSQKSKLEPNNPLRGDVKAVHPKINVRPNAPSFGKLIEDEINYLQSIADEARTVKDAVDNNPTKVPISDTPVQAPVEPSTASEANTAPVQPVEANAPLQETIDPETGKPLAPEEIQFRKQGSGDLTDSRGSALDTIKNIASKYNLTQTVKRNRKTITEPKTNLTKAEQQTLSKEDLKAYKEATASRKQINNELARRKRLAQNANPNLQGDVVLSRTPKNVRQNEAPFDSRIISEQFDSKYKTVESTAEHLFLNTGVFTNNLQDLLNKLIEINGDLKSKLTNPNSDLYKALATVHSRYMQFNELINGTSKKAGIFKSIGENRSIGNVSGIDLFRNLALSLAQRTDIKQGPSNQVLKFRPELVAAMSISSGLWLHEMGSGTLILDRTTIAKMFGIDDREITNEQIQVAQRNGIRRSLVSNSIGSRIYQTLGIKPKNTASELARTRLISALGGMALAVMDQLNEVDITSRGYTEVNDEFFGPDRIKQDKAIENTQLATVKVKSNPEDDTKIHDDIEKITDSYKKLDGIEIGEKLFGINTEVRTPSLEPIPNVQTQSNDGLSDITDEQQAAALEAQNVPHRLVGTTTETVRLLGKQFMYRLMGLQSLKNTHINNKATTEGKNLQIKESVRKLFDSISEYTGVDFYLKQNIAASRRSYVASNQLDPQSDKMHRFMVRRANGSVEVSFNETELLNAFKVAVAVAFDGDNEKKSLNANVEYFDKTFTDEYLNKVIFAFTQLNKLDNKAIPKKNRFAIEQKVMGLLGDGDGRSPHGLHALTELHEYAKAKKAGAKSFTTEIVMESDGVTSGSAIGFTQLAHAFTDFEPRDNFKDPLVIKSNKVFTGWLERFGLFQKSTGYKSYADWRHSKSGKVNRDSYEHMAESTVKALSKQLAQLKAGELGDFFGNNFDDSAESTVDSAAQKKIAKAQQGMEEILGSFTAPLEAGSTDTLITKAARNLMKDPFMIFGYGAGQIKIYQALARQTVDKMLTGIEDAVQNGDEKELARLNKAMIDLVGMANPNVAPATGVNKFPAKGRFQSLDNALSTSILADRALIEANMVAILRNTVGATLEQELGGFKQIRDQMNHGFQIQFVAFDAAMKKQIKELSKNNPPGQPATIEQVQRAMSHVAYLMPSFQGAMNGSSQKQRISIMKSESDFGAGGEDAHQSLVKIYFEGQTKKQSGNVKEPSAQTRAARQIFVDGGVAGAVIMIHSLDATIQQRAMKDKAVLNVFDAGVTDIKQSAAYAKAYNKAWVELWRDYDILNDVLSMMQVVEDTPEITQFLTTDRKMLNSRGEPKYKSVKHFKGRLFGDLKKSRAAKAAILKDGMYVAQMAHPDPESVYYYPGEAESKRKPVFFRRRHKSDKVLKQEGNYIPEKDTGIIESNTPEGDISKPNDQGEIATPVTTRSEPNATESDNQRNSTPETTNPEGQTNAERTAQESLQITDEVYTPPFDPDPIINEEVYNKQFDGKAFLEIGGGVNLRESTDNNPLVRTARNAVYDALKKLNFKFLDEKGAPNVELIETIASKIIHGKSLDDPQFINEASAALSFVVYSQLGISDNNKQKDVIRSYAHKAIHDFLTTGKIPTKRLPLWNRIKITYDKLIAFFKGEEYDTILQRLDDTLNTFKTGNLADIIFQAKEGYGKLNFQTEMDNNPQAVAVLRTIQDSGIKFVMTGSTAYADQIPVYRKIGKPIHDIDLLLDKADIPNGVRALTTGNFGRGAIMYDFRPKGKRVLGLAVVPAGYEIKNYHASRSPDGTKDIRRSYEVYDQTTGKQVGSYKFEANNFEIFEGIAGVSVDLMEDHPELNQTQTFKDGDETVSIKVASYIHGFAAKLSMLRGKDIQDYLAVIPPNPERTQTNLVAFGGQKGLPVKSKHAEKTKTAVAAAMSRLPDSIRTLFNAKINVSDYLDPLSDSSTSLITEPLQVRVVDKIEGNPNAAGVYHLINNANQLSHVLDINSELAGKSLEEIHRERPGTRDMNQEQIFDFVVNHELGHAIDNISGFPSQNMFPSVKINELKADYEHSLANLDSTNEGVRDTYNYLELLFRSYDGMDQETHALEIFANFNAWYNAKPETLQRVYPTIYDQMETIYASIRQQAIEINTATTSKGSQSSQVVDGRQLDPGGAVEAERKTGADRQKAILDNLRAKRKAGQTKADKEETERIIKAAQRSDYRRRLYYDNYGSALRGDVFTIPGIGGNNDITVSYSFRVLGEFFTVYHVADGQEVGWNVVHDNSGTHFLAETSSSYKTGKSIQEAAVGHIRELGTSGLRKRIQQYTNSDGYNGSVTNQGNILGSSDVPIDPDTFIADMEKTVTSENVAGMFNLFGNLQADIDPNHTQHLTDLIDSLISKALKPIDDITLKIKQDQFGESAGVIAGHEIYINNASTRKTYVEQTAQEVYVHELFHAISTYWLDHNPTARLKLRRLFDLAKANTTYEAFLRRDSNGNILYLNNKQEEIDRAKSMRDYVFRLGESADLAGAPRNNQIREFFTYAMTNPQMIAHLKTLKTRKSRHSPENNLFNSFIATLNDLLNWVFERFNATSSQNIHAEIDQIAHSIIGVERANAFRIMDKIEYSFTKTREAVFDNNLQGIVSSVGDMASKFGDQTGSNVITDSVRAVAGIAGDIQGYRDSVRHLPGDSPGRVAVRDAVRNVLDTMTKPDGAIREVVDSVVDKSEKFGAFHELLRKSKHLIDQLRETVGNTISRNVRSEFLTLFDHTSNSTDESSAVTKMYLMTDVDSLDNYTPDQIAELFDSEDILAADIKAKRNAIRKNLTKDEFRYIQQQSKGLASLMVDGFTQTYNQRQNADQILFPINKADLRPQLDEYISLLAIQTTHPSIRHMAARVTRAEYAADSKRNGITYIRTMHRAFKKDSLERLFSGNPMLTRKGYISDVYETGRSILIAPTANEAVLKKDGYTLKYAVTDDDTVTFKGVPKSLYVATNHPTTQRVKTIVSIADKNSFGTTLSESRRAGESGYNQVLDTLQFVKTRREYDSRAKQGKLASGSALIPIFDEQGNIVDYRYGITEAKKHELLQKDFRVEVVMGRMHASIESKANSESINRELVHLAHDDYKKNYRDNPDEFIQVSSDPKSEHFETYKLLPKAMKRDIERIYGSTTPMYVRKTLFRMVFGFRKASAANLEFIKKVGLAPLVRTIENGWQAIIAQEKINIVIKNITTMVDNILSNTLLLKVKGVPFSDIINDTKEAVLFMNQYQKDFENLKNLEKLATGNPNLLNKKAFRHKISFLKQELKDNPVSELVDEGIFQSITEDLDADQYGDKSKLIKWLSESAIGRVTPEAIKNGLNIAYLSENTQAFKFLLKTTQYSDFTARYVLIKHRKKDKNADHKHIIREAVNTFINYDVPDNKFLQYANDIGLFMFTKFALRIQPIIVDLFDKNTGNAITSLLAQQFLGDYPDIPDSFAPITGLTHILHADVLDHLANATTPHLFVALSNVLPFV